MNQRRRSANFAGVTISKPVVVVAALGALFLAAGGGWWIYQRSFVAWEAAKRQQDVAAGAARAESRVRQRVEIHPGPETPVVLARHATTAGNLAAVACSTCHTTRQPNLEIRSAAALREFHQGLTYRHGELSCLSCHHAANYDTLRRADGSAVAYPQTIQLCAQCHGTHYRDYLHGSHGGMTGFWDLTRGPRERNTCTDCHDPHAPLYPRVTPVFAPRDRGAQQQRERAAHVHGPGKPSTDS